MYEEILVLKQLKDERFKTFERKNWKSLIGVNGIQD